MCGRADTMPGTTISGSSVGLLGYAILGKGFAYVGAPPLFIGEILFAGGLLVLVGTGCLLSTLTVLPNLMFLLLAAWVLIRTVPFLSIYGTDAVRDSVVVHRSTWRWKVPCWASGSGSCSAWGAVRC